MVDRDFNGHAALRLDCEEKTQESGGGVYIRLLAPTAEAGEVAEIRPRAVYEERVFIEAHSDKAKGLHCAY
jgi:hypothetical protein